MKKQVLEIDSYKVGDWVVIIDNINGGHPVGAVGTISKVNIYDYRVDVNEENYYHTAKSLRKATAEEVKEVKEVKVAIGYRR